MAEIVEQEYSSRELLQTQRGSGSRRWGGGLLSSFVTGVSQFLRHRPIDWWGLLGLFVITTVVVGLILIRERKHTPLPSAPDEQGDNAELRAAIKEFANGHNSGEVLKAGVWALDTFTQLQMAAFQLAKNPKGLLAELPSPKKTDYAAYNVERGWFRTTNDVHIWGDAKSAADDKLRARYVLNFQTTAIYHRFVEAGLTDRHLGVLADTARKEEDFVDMITVLRADALKIDDA